VVSHSRNKKLPVEGCSSNTPGNSLVELIVAFYPEERLAARETKIPFPPEEKETGYKHFS